MKTRANLERKKLMLEYLKQPEVYEITDVDRLANMYLGLTSSISILPSTQETFEETIFSGQNPLEVVTEGSDALEISDDVNYIRPEKPSSSQQNGRPKTARFDLRRGNKGEETRAILEDYHANDDVL